MDPMAEYDPPNEKRAVIWMVVGCGLLVALGVAVGVANRPLATPVTLGNLEEAHLVEIRDHRGVTVLSGELRSRKDVLGNIEKDAALADRRGERVIGEIEVEIPAASRENRRPELEVDIIGLPPAATFTVVIDDREVGRFTTDDRGSIDQELQEGEMPAPPIATAGTM